MKRRHVKVRPGRRWKIRDLFRRNHGRHVKTKGNARHG